MFKEPFELICYICKADKNFVYLQYFLIFNGAMLYEDKAGKTIDVLGTTVRVTFLVDSSQTLYDTSTIKWTSRARPSQDANLISDKNIELMKLGKNCLFSLVLSGMQIGLYVREIQLCFIHGPPIGRDHNRLADMLADIGMHMIFQQA